MPVHLTTEVEEGAVSVDGAEVRYYVSGRPHPTRPPLVLVHGTGGSTATHFAMLFPMVATRQQVVSLDLAEPAGVSALTLEHLERQVGAVVDEALPEGPISLLGYSLGSVVAASYAAHHADRVENLVLVAGWIKTDHQQRLRNDLYQFLRKAGDPDAFRAYSRLFAFGVPFLAKRSPEDMDVVAPPGRPSTFGALQMDLNRTIDISDRVADIAATTLVVGGTHDLMVPRHHSLALFGAIDDARYAEIGSGHSVFVERPAELLSIAENFLSHPRRHPAGTVIPPAQP
ncbi:alpha/beta hydrolase [Microbacterium betulae]|uniref:Alpha/beta hydrolase n=1 Tax=Microbacterium betulae TaxID=2981139 RepID=A0AA97FH10_9MICO|nr:alpha/beta hydrolase [Microbacterium sp. AB]WOF22840.1 alpha/beta hydrolase [Microbacterium sp. AB]